MELGPRKRPAHGVRDNRSPMQAPVRARSIGEIRPPDFAPARAQQKMLPLPTLMGNRAKFLKRVPVVSDNRNINENRNNNDDRNSNE